MFNSLKIKSRIKLLLLSSLSLILLTGCGSTSDTQIASSSLQALKDAGSWKANATWKFQSVDKPVVMSGIGSWWDSGKQMHWQESWGSIRVSLKTEGDALVLEDKSKIKINSKAAADRISSDLFYTLEPLKILVDSKILLTPVNGEKDRYFGEGICLETTCKVDLLLKRVNNLPVRAVLFIQQPNNWINIEFNYSSKLH